MKGRTSVFCLAVVVGLSGCSTGPGVSRYEIDSARQDLEAKRLRHHFREEARLARVGYRILHHLPADARRGEYPFAGILVRENDKKVRQALSRGPEKGLVVTGLLSRETARQSQLEVGDLIQTIGGVPTSREKEFKKFVSVSRPGDKLRIRVKRRGVVFDSELPVETIWRKVEFKLNDRKKDVNAYATFFGVQFTLPMMSFLGEEDQLAVIVGHEVAHIVKGHVPKNVGTSSLAGVLGGLAAIPLNMLLPGAGSVVSYFVTATVQAQFSQEFEKEADYLGLLLAHEAGYDIQAGARVWERFAVELPRRVSLGFMNTHPSTPERVARTEKVISTIKAEKLVGTKVYSNQSEA